MGFQKSMDNNKKTCSKIQTSDYQDIHTFFCFSPIMAVSGQWEGNSPKHKCSTYIRVAFFRNQFILGYKTNGNSYWNVRF